MRAQQNQQICIRNVTQFFENRIRNRIQLSTRVELEDFSEQFDWTQVIVKPIDVFIDQMVNTWQTFQFFHNPNYGGSTYKEIEWSLGNEFLPPFLVCDDGDTLPIFDDVEDFSPENIEKHYNFVQSIFSQNVKRILMAKEQLREYFSQQNIQAQDLEREFQAVSFVNGSDGNPVLLFKNFTLIEDYEEEIEPQNVLFEDLNYLYLHGINLYEPDIRIQTKTYRGKQYYILNQGTLISGERKQQLKALFKDLRDQTIHLNQEREYRKNQDILPFLNKKVSYDTLFEDIQFRDIQPEDIWSYVISRRFIQFIEGGTRQNFQMFDGNLVSFLDPDFVRIVIRPFSHTSQLQTLNILCRAVNCYNQLRREKKSYKLYGPYLNEKSETNYFPLPDTIFVSHGPIVFDKNQSINSPFMIAFQDEKFKETITNGDFTQTERFFKPVRFFNGTVSYFITDFFVNLDSLTNFEFSQQIKKIYQQKINN